MTKPRLPRKKFIPLEVAAQCFGEDVICNGLGKDGERMSLWMIGEDHRPKHLGTRFWPRGKLDFARGCAVHPATSHWCKVAIPRADLVACFGEPGGNPPTSKGGRPATWDWEAFWCELTGIVHEYGLPEVQARLVERMQQWFIDKYDEHPHESDIKKRVIKLYRRLKDG
jgi:hypothetical protein